MRRLLLLIITFSTIYSINNFAQTNELFEISIDLPAFSNRTAKLGYYYGNKTYLADTFLLDGMGRSLYSGKYHDGLYVLLLPDSTTFEFMVTDKSKYSITCPVIIAPNECIITGNPVAEAYVHYQNQTRSVQSTIDSLLKMMQTSQIVSEKAAVKKQVQHRQNQIDSISIDFIRRYDGTLPANYLKALLPLKILPYESTDSGLKKDSMLWMSGLNYYYQHFFDNIDWNDARLIYTPVIADKVDYYLDKLTTQQPLQLAQAIDTILAKPQDSEIRKYIINQLLSRYRKLKHDALAEYIYIHLIEGYILENEDSILPDKEVMKLEEECKRLKPVSLLNKAPDISLPDKNKNIKTLYEINSPLTIVYFWDYNCSICRRVLSELAKVISKYNYLEIQVYTIFTGSDLDIWQAFLAKKIPENWVNTYQTGSIQYISLYNLSNLPAIFLLDKDKTILEKNLTVPEIDTYLYNLTTENKK